ncbi:ImmA/IrrE family metallo-endopeptidase [Streptomyces parvus]|uniref:ImmA/IrrE family metallo-endopeptidase n=1 Tax=Streptomyces parvus TaxID=66428 RepID=UPI003D7509D6
MNWKQAHMVAFTAAARALAKYGVDDRERIDVFAAMDRAGFDIMGRPMPGLFGLYLAGTGATGPAALLNSRMSEATIRHTAAHELGHHVLGHASQVDYDLNDLHTGKRSWTKEEQEAEAFAAWFLMPRKAMNRVLFRIGCTTLSAPRDVYQMALWLGVSYAGVLRQAQNIKMLSRAQATAWSQAASGRPAPGAWQPVPQRVWELGPSADGTTIHVQTGDRLRIGGGDSDAVPELPKGLDPQGPTGTALDVDVTSVFNAPGNIRTGRWSIGIIPTPCRRGCVQSWPTWAGGSQDDEGRTEVR